MAPKEFAFGMIIATEAASVRQNNEQSRGVLSVGRG
jgi:hypothetical protein